MGNDRDFARVTGNPEVIRSSVGLILTNALLGTSTSGSSANRKLSRNGLGGNPRDLLEADFWPGITSGLPDTRPQSRASEHGHSSNFDKPKSQHSLDESAYIVLLYCLASHPIRVERISS
jgi:hypothetical protein